MKSVINMTKASAPIIRCLCHCVCGVLGVFSVGHISNAVYNFRNIAMKNVTNGIKMLLVGAAGLCVNVNCTVPTMGLSDKTSMAEAEIIDEGRYPLVCEHLYNMPFFLTDTEVTEAKKVVAVLVRKEPAELETMITKSADVIVRMLGSTERFKEVLKCRSTYGLPQDIRAKACYFGMRIAECHRGDGIVALCGYPAFTCRSREYLGRIFGFFEYEGRATGMDKDFFEACNKLSIICHGFDLGTWQAGWGMVASIVSGVWKETGRTINFVDNK